MGSKVLLYECLFCATRVLIYLYLLNAVRQDSLLQCQKAFSLLLPEGKPRDNWPPPSLSAEFKCHETFTWGILGRWEILKVDLNLKIFFRRVLFLNAWYRYVYKENRYIGKQCRQVWKSLSTQAEKAQIVLSLNSFGFQFWAPSQISSVSLDNLLRHRTSQALQYLHAQVTPIFQLLFRSSLSTQRGSNTPVPCGVLWESESNVDALWTEL